MYTGFPRWARNATKVALASAWVSLAFAGLSAAVNPSPAVTSIIDWWRVVVAIGFLGFGIFGALGASMERYRWEWLSAWGALVCIVPYVVIAWAGAMRSGYYAGAWLFTGLAFLLLTRALFCSGFAGKLRAEYLAGDNRELPTRDIVGDD